MAEEIMAENLAREEWIAHNRLDRALTSAVNSGAFNDHNVIGAWFDVGLQKFAAKGFATWAEAEKYFKTIGVHETKYQLFDRKPNVI